MKWVIASLVPFALGSSASVDAQGLTEVVVTGTKAPVGSETRSKTVSYADLDLSKSAGLGTLLDRIHNAASDVCSPAPSDEDSAGNWGGVHIRPFHESRRDKAARLKRASPIFEW